MAYASISKPSLHFNTKLYTGNGSTRSITGVGFQPDWIWIKDRSQTNAHRLNDSVRGAKILASNNKMQKQQIQCKFNCFDSDGFTHW